MRRTAVGVPPMFGVVVFDTEGGRRRVRETVLVFATAPVADDYAKAEGLADYEVTPLRMTVADPTGSVVGRGTHLVDDRESR